MILYAISGNGIGAGKTTFAMQVAAPNVVSLAGELRRELSEIYPRVDWFDRRQSAKECRHPDLDGKSVREVMIAHGQRRCFESPTYWVDRAMENIRQRFVSGVATVAIDDVRKVVEIARLREIAAHDPTFFSGVLLLHMHMIGPHVIPEPEFPDAAQLEEMSDYVVRW